MIYGKTGGEGTTIPVISSDLAEMVRLAENIVVMANKCVVGNFQDSGSFSVVSKQVMDAIVKAASSEGP